jgi:hypothetical protein
MNLRDRAIEETRKFRNAACANLLDTVSEEIMQRAEIGKINAFIDVTRAKESHILHVASSLRYQGFKVFVSSDEEGKHTEMQVSWDIYEE